MTKLPDTQLTILSTAAQRPDGNLLPLPGSLRGGAAGKVITAEALAFMDKAHADSRPNNFRGRVFSSHWFGR